MTESPSRAFWLEVVGLGLAAALLFRFGLLLVLFMVPLQVAWMRRGERAGLTACAAFLVIVSLLKILDVVRMRAAGVDGPIGLALVDLVLPIAFFAGLFLLNRRELSVRVGLSGGETEGARYVAVRLAGPQRLLAAAVAGAAVLAPVFIIVARSGLVEQLFSVQLALLQELAGGFDAGQAEVQELLSFAVRVFLATFLTSFTGILAVNWWLGIRLVSRVRWAAAEPNAVEQRLSRLQFDQFRLAEWYVWLLIAGWGLVVLSLVMGLGVLGIIAWNLALLSTLLYGIQGLAVLWHLLARRGLQRQARVGVGIALTFALLVPVVNVMVLVGVPGLGVSEIWVNYHRFERSGNQDEGNSE